MIAFLYLIGHAFASLFHSVNEEFEDLEAKQRTSDGVIYYDSKGRLLSVRDNHPVVTKYNETYGLIEYIDLKTRRVIKKEYTQGTIEDIKKAKDKGRTVYLSQTHTLMKDFGRQDKYIDVDTHQEYVVRKIRDRYYYISTYSNRVVRETDKSKLKIIDGDGIHKDELNKFVDSNRKTTDGFPEVSFNCIDCDGAYN